MLSGQELGKAIAAAIKLKQVTQKAVAAEFGVAQPSVSEWIRYGRIDKKHLSHLIEYFSDVVGAGHWGLSDELSHSAVMDSSASWPFVRITSRQWLSLSERQRGAIEDAAVAKLKELRSERAGLGGANTPPAPIKPPTKRAA